jgi:hypothetical protein
MQEQRNGSPLNPGQWRPTLESFRMPDSGEKAVLGQRVSFEKAFEPLFEFAGATMGGIALASADGRWEVRRGRCSWLACRGIFFSWPRDLYGLDSGEVAWVLGATRWIRKRLDRTRWAATPAKEEVDGELGLWIAFGGTSSLDYPIDASAARWTTLPFRAMPIQLGLGWLGSSSSAPLVDGRDDVATPGGRSRQDFSPNSDAGQS